MVDGDGAAVVLREEDGHVPESLGLGRALARESESPLSDPLRGQRLPGAPVSARTYISSVRSLSVALGVAGLLACLSVTATPPASAAAASDLPVSYSPASMPSPECTITGTQRRDVLRGTPGDDVICGFGGRDRIMGLGGHDILLGGSGSDVISGGPGNDVLVGGPGRDVGSGGRGANLCAPESGLGDCAHDAQAPALTDVAFPQESTAGSELGISWSALDAAGLMTWVRVLGRDGELGWCRDVVPTRGAGPASDRYSITCQIPPTAAAGDYAVVIGAVDELGNGLEIQAPLRLAASGSETEPPVVGPSPEPDPNPSPQEPGPAPMPPDPLPGSGIPPVLSDVTVPDIVNAGSDLSVSWTATDEGAVTSWARVGGRNGFASWCFDVPTVQEPAPSGRFTLTCQVPEVIPNGEYTVFIGAADQEGNYSETQANFMVGGGSDDGEAPTVIAAPVLPAVVPGDSFVLRWELSDPSGVSYTEAWIYTPEGSLVGYDQKPGSTTAPAQVVEGDATRGIWEQAFTLSTEASSASYLVTLSIRDAVGNRDVVTIGSISVGGAATPDCSQDPAAQDCGPRGTSPFVSDVELPATVSPGEAFTISWVANGAEGFSTFAGVNGSMGSESWCGDNYVVEGVRDLASGRYSVECQAPRMVRNGTYTVSITIQGAPTGYVQAFATIDLVNGSDGDQAPTIGAAPSSIGARLDRLPDAGHV